MKIKMNHKALVNIAYCPQIREFGEILDYLARIIDNGITENKPIILQN